VGIFSFLSGKKKKSKDANTNSSSSNYTSDNYLQASGIGSQIANDQIDNLINNNQDLKNKAGYGHLTIDKIIEQEKLSLRQEEIKQREELKHSWSALCQ